MPSRYDDLNFNSGTYIPQYAALPLEQIQRSADTLSARHYQNLASGSKLELLANQMKSQALEGARPYFDTHISAIDEALKDMAKNGGENSTTRINALATAFQGDQGINLAGQRAEEYRNIMSEVQKLGDQAVYHKDKLEALRNASITTKDKEGKEVLNPLYSNQFNLPVNPYLDPTLDYKRITDEIKPDKWLVGGLSEAGQIKFNDAKMHLDDGTYDIPKFLQEVEAAGVSSQKIGQLKDEMFKAFKNTKSYSQQGEYFGRDDAAQAEDLYNYAKLGVYNQVDRKFHQVPITKGAGEGKPELPLVGPVLSPADINNKVRPKLSSDFNFTNLDTGIKGLIPGGAPVMTHISGGPTKEEVKTASDNDFKYYKAMVESTGYNPIVPAPGGTAPQPTEEQLRKDATSKPGLAKTKEWLNSIYQDELSNAYAQPIPLDATSRGILDNLLQRNAANWNYYDLKDNILYSLDDNGKFSGDWRDKTGGDVTKFELANEVSPYSIRAGKIKEDAAASGLFQVQAQTKDGPKTFYISNPGLLTTAKGRLKANTNIIYNKVIENPATEVEIGGIKAKLLIGKQKETAKTQYATQFTPEEFDVMSSNSPLIEVTLPNGFKTVTTPAKLAANMFQATNLSYKNK